MADVILKMDDLNEESWASFYRVYKMCRQLQVSPSFGAIGSSVKKGSKAYISSLVEMRKNGVELWNHGFHHVIEEFSKNSYEEQKESIRKTQDAFLEKLGYAPITFGSPYNNGKETTVKVLKENFCEIKNYFFMVDGGEKPIAKQLLSRCNCERVAGDIDLDYFEKEYNRLKNADYFVIQSHPGKWKEKDYQLFERMVKKLLSDKNTIVTPEELEISNISVNSMYRSQIALFFETHKEIFLYGAGEVGRELYKYFYINNKQIAGYIVSDGQECANTVCGQPVIYFKDFCEKYQNENVGIIVAGSGKFLSDIRSYVGHVAEKIWVEFTDEEYDRFIDYVRLVVT